MVKIGITGGIGSGKTTVAKIFSLLEIPVYIADERSKKLVDESQTIKKKLTELFGSDIVHEGKINRKKLAEIIFNNRDSLLSVNAIIHPEVRKDYIEWCNHNSDSEFTVLESAILFESNFSSFVDYSINVISPLEDRINNCIKRDNCSKEVILQRMNNQMPDSERNKKADFVIFNDEKHSLIEQAINILKTIKNDEI